MLIHCTTFWSPFAILLFYQKQLRGALSKYKNMELQSKESEAWSRAVVEEYENS
jgi:hypothetical protein